MAGNIQRIVKDGLQAFAFWAVASLAMVYFLGDFGKLLSIGLGVIFIVAFCALRAAELLGWLFHLGNRPAPPAWQPPASAPPAAPPVQLEYCPKCGAKWVAGAQQCANCG